MESKIRDQLESVEGVSEVVVDDDSVFIHIRYHTPTQNGYQLSVSSLRGIGSQISRMLEEVDDEYVRIKKPEPIMGAQRYDTYKYEFERQTD